MAEKSDYAGGDEYGRLKPTVDSAFSNGWNRTWRNFFELMLAVLILIAVSIPIGVIAVVMGNNYFDEPGRYGLFLFFYAILVITPLKYGLEYMYLLAARSERCGVLDFSKSYGNFLNVILAAALVQVMISAGVVFFIVPGIILACKLAFVPYLVVGRRMGAIDAIAASWEMTRGHAFDIFLIYLFSIPINIAGFLCLGVGFIPATIWCGVTMASMYSAVELKREEPVFLKEA